MRKTEAKNRIHDTRVGTFSEKSEENLSEIAKNAAHIRTGATFPTCSRSSVTERRIHP